MKKFDPWKVQKIMYNKLMPYDVTRDKIVALENLAILDSVEK